VGGVEVQLHTYVTLALDDVGVRLKQEWRFTSASLICLLAVGRENFTFTTFKSTNERNN
jgi:hypothetical protein